MLVVWSAMAFAQPEPEVEPEGDPEPAAEDGRVILSVDDDLGSALAGDGGLQATSLAGAEEEWEALPDGTLRGRWYGKPQASVGLFEGAAAVRLGVTVGHNWWQLGDRPLQLGGHTQLSATAPLGGATGHRLTLQSTVGPWIGPVGIAVGAGARWDREDWGTAGLLDSGVGVGPRAQIGVSLGPLRPSVSGQVDWFVVGDRLTDFGPETTVGAGLGWEARGFTVSVQGHRRHTAIGPLHEVGLGLHVRPPI